MTVSHELQCTTRPSSVAAVQDFIDRCLLWHDLDSDWLRDVHVIADELASNIEKYAYGAGPGTYVVRVTVDEGCLTVEFEDAGNAFDPTHVTETPIDGDHDRPAGNLGLLLVKSLVDRMSYARCEGQNVTTIAMRIPQKKLVKGEPRFH